MRLTRLLNACHPLPGFVSERARLCEASHTIAIDVRARRGAKARCSGCRRPAPGYDQLGERRFEFIPLWGFAVVLLYAMRRVQCPRCGVKVEQVPWAVGKHTLCQAYRLFLAQLAAKAVLERDRAGVPELPGEGLPCRRVRCPVGFAAAQPRGDPRHRGGRDPVRPRASVSLVYQIEAGCQRLLWAGKQRTTESFEQFFTMLGQELSAGIEFVCSDMWKPYLDLIQKHCTQALNILDRFHLVAKMNLALDDVRAAEARALVQDGYEPVLKKSRWCPPCLPIPDRHPSSPLAETGCQCGA